jgi:hypothetical protein
MSKILIEEINRNRKVMGVQPLTESQEIDLILEDINKGVLNEGWWETTKYALSKLGRYKADGKIFGKTQATAQAESKIRDLLMKKGNEIIRKKDLEAEEMIKDGWKYCPRLLWKQLKLILQRQAQMVCILFLMPCICQSITHTLKKKLKR